MARAVAKASTAGLATAALLVALGGCATAPRTNYGAQESRPRAYNRPYTVHGRTYTPAQQPDYDEVGTASWYGYESGRRTSSGEPLVSSALTAAHRTLPIPSILEITNLQNGRTIRARLNDRGPFRPGRLIDVSHEAARQLGFLGAGSARVRVRYLGPADPRARAAVATPPTTPSFETAAVVAGPSEPGLARVAGVD